MSEHPPIPEEAYDAAHKAIAELRDAHEAGLRGAPRTIEIVATAVRMAAPILWCAWTKGRAVVELPEREHVERSFPESAGGIHQWTPAGVSLAAFLQRGGGRVDMEFGDFSIDWPADVARLVFAAGLAAADRAEQLAAEHNTAPPTECDGGYSCAAAEHVQGCLSGDRERAGEVSS